MFMGIFNSFTTVREPKSGEHVNIVLAVMCVCLSMCVWVEAGESEPPTSHTPLELLYLYLLTPSHSCLSCSSPLSSKKLITHPCHVAVTVQFMGISFSFCLCLQPCSSYLHLSTAEWLCFIARLSLKKMSSVIGWFLVMCAGEIQMYPDWDTIAQLLPTCIFVCLFLLYESLNI